VRIGGGGGASPSHAQNGSTALMHAAAEGRTDCVQLLLGAGADINAKANVRGRFAASEFTFAFIILG
jgi:ankyrin repeat protein